MGRANPLDPERMVFYVCSITCTRSQCPEMPKVTLDQAVIDLMESIALQETALSHILCAESQKMKVAMGLDGLDLCKLLEVNDSATNMVHAVANLELVLKDKLEFISNNLSRRTAAAHHLRSNVFWGGALSAAI